MKNADEALRYDAFMGRWSRLLASQFVNWLAVGPGRRWLDVGCGTGALTKAILERSAPREICGLDPCEKYISHARSILPQESCHFVIGDTAALIGPPPCFDVAVSGLVLNLVPDPRAALEHMTRITRLEGVIGAYVWDFAEGMQVVRRFWDAAISLDSAAEAHDQARLYPLCHPDRLAGLFTQAGLQAVEIRSIEINAVFCDFNDYWQGIELGHGRAPAYAAGLSPTHRDRLRVLLKSNLPASQDGSISLTARAWAVRGVLAGKPPV